MDLSYDESKRQLTLAKRRLDFAHAGNVFADFHFSEADDRFDYGEVRWITVGSLDADIVVIVWTEREDSRRIISMRKARIDEREKYRKRLG